MASPHASPNLGLDVVRAAAILAVIFSHTADWYLGTSRATDIRAAYIGGAGVEVFFSLSGFLIGTILLRALDRGLTLAALGRFWSRRWLRTLPAYWVLIGGLCAWFGVFDWRSLVFVQTFAPKTLWAPFTPHTWSLVLEEWFYLFVPPLVLIASRLLPLRWAIPAVCMVLVAACTTLRVWAVEHPNPAFWGDDLTINPFLHLDCAALGLAGAWLLWAGVRFRPWPAAALLALGLVLLLALGVLFELTFTPERLVPFGYLRWAIAWAAGRTSLTEFAALCALLGLGALLPVTPRPGRGTPWRTIATWPIGAVARLSYALYLVHVPVIYLGRYYGLDDRTGWPARLQVLALVILAAAALRTLVELPVLALRDHLLPDRRPSPAQA